ncbi:MSHA biogenesis protein MshN [Photobacterium marinum]|uniref:MSHA biogenesis protein MshN n=1 Tax=Photobacterium marinum TaxID=1056511 RepID=L8JFX0_9GAMM|nr:tetratricopeptide repeat protein [Photobacterium marinum]ELR66317.1 MSHA biogenesis protein MshN [Photobacterium marinum]
MSEINKKLNELSRKNNSTAAAPLQAATIRPVPRNRAPYWAGSVVVIALVAGAAGWWFGSQSLAGQVTQAAQQEEEREVHDDFVVQVESVRQNTAKPSVAMTLPTQEQPVESQKVSEPTVESEVVEPLQTVENKTQLPEPSKRTVVRVKAESKAGPISVSSGPEQKQQMPAPVITKVVKAKPSASKPQKPLNTEPATVSESAEVMNTASSDEQLSIETVELDAGQLAEIEYEKAHKAWENGDSKKAIGYLESAVIYQPEWVKARQKLSALYYGRGEVREAIATLQHGLELDSKQLDLRLTLAKLLANESQPQAALNVLNQLPEKHHSGYLAMRGALAQQLNNNRLAMSSYRMLVKDEPYDGRWWMGLGIALERDAQESKARDAYQQALLMGRISSQSQQFIQQRLTALDSREG